MHQNIGASRRLYLEYGVLALLIVGPLLLPGYIFALDLLFTPHLRPPATISNLYAFEWVLYALDQLLPSQLLEKLIFLLIPVLAGVGMHRFIRSRLVKLRTTAAEWPAYFAGIFYVINPFTYTRFMQGHILLLLAYALTPWFLTVLLRWLEQPNRRDLLKLSLLATLISLLSLHAIFFLVLVSGVFASVFLVSGRRRPGYGRYVARVLGQAAAGVAIVVLASAYWLVPTVQGNAPLATQLRGFDASDAQDFQTIPDPRLGLLPNVVALYGFWGDDDRRYAVPKDHNPLWIPLGIGLLALSVLGVRQGWRHDRPVTVGFVIAGAVALVLAAGVAFKPLAGLSEWLIAEVPFYAGFREPQKFVALLVLVYAYFGAWGARDFLAWMARLSRQRWQAGLTAGVLLLPILYTPTMLAGFAGQLKPADFPADWYALDRHLTAEPDADFRVLWLPWHHYQSFGFAGNRVIANPAERFFERPVLISGNPEFGTSSAPTPDSDVRYVDERIIQPGPTVTELGTKLSQLKVKYVVLAKEADWRDYDYLHRQPDLVIERQSQTLILYKNLQYGRGTALRERP